MILYTALDNGTPIARRVEQMALASGWSHAQLH
jgi:hypothetical protein